MFERLWQRLPAQTWAKLCGIFSGITFGIYWIPLRAMDQAGISGMWAVVVFNLVSFTLLLPWVIRHRRQLIPGRGRVQAATCVAGFAYVLYVGSFLYTEVVRVLVLFYLMPIWGFVMARIWIGEAITPVRWLSMVLGLAGLVVICGIESGIPLPQNTGDWMALIAGILWAGCALSLLTDRTEPFTYGVTFLFWSAVWALVVGFLVSRAGLVPFPVWDQLGGILLWLVPLAIIVIIPAAFATLYAPTQLNPGIVGLLFMTEISVGVVTAALFAGEPFGVREITGVVLITLAGVAEPLQLLARRKAAA